MEVQSLIEAADKARMEYMSALAAGQRLQVEREVFRARMAGLFQGDRYRNMAFRIFRNDALQRYQAAFDLAARYVALAVKAYDYETALPVATDRTQWLLIIPGRTLSNDGVKGIQRFIHGTEVSPGVWNENGVRDIRMYFQIYSYAGN
jgi:hypothetical protein